jgi:hypothetical protein
VYNFFEPRLSEVTNAFTNSKAVNPNTPNLYFMKSLTHIASQDSSQGLDEKAPFFENTVWYERRNIE